MQGLLGYKPASQATGAAAAPRPPLKEPPSLVRTALRCLLYQPGLAAEVSAAQELAKIEQPGMALLIDVLETLRSNPNLRTAALLERWRDTAEGKQLEKLATWQPSLDDPDSLQQEFLGALARLEEQHRDTRTRTLLAKANQGGLSREEKAELQALLRRRQPG